MDTKTIGAMAGAAMRRRRDELEKPMLYAYWTCDEAPVAPPWWRFWRRPAHRRAYEAWLARVEAWTPLTDRVAAAAAEAQRETT